MFQAENHMACGKGRANSRAHVWDTGATQIPSAPGSPLGEARNAAITEARLHGGAVAGVSKPRRPCPRQQAQTTPAGHSHGGPPSPVQPTQTHLLCTSAKFNHSKQVVFHLYLWFHFPQFTSSQLQSEDIKWKIPEINNS